MTSIQHLLCSELKRTNINREKWEKKIKPIAKFPQTSFRMCWNSVLNTPGSVLLGSYSSQWDRGPELNNFGTDEYITLVCMYSMKEGLQMTRQKKTEDENWKGFFEKLSPCAYLIFLHHPLIHVTHVSTARNPQAEADILYYKIRVSVMSFWNTTNSLIF
jgi:hypothetical protein